MFQDSEPSIAVRKPVRSDLSYTHSPMRIDTTKSAEAPGPSPDLQLRKSTDQLIVSSSSGPSSPGSPPSVPPHMQYTPAVHSESRRQTRSYSSENETIPAKPADTPGRMSTQSTIVRQDYSPARNTATVNKPSHSRLSSTDSFNASALAYGQSAPQDGPRKMTQKDFEAAKKQEQYDEKMRMRHGNTLNDDDLAEYDDVDDEEDLKKIAKEKERRDAMLSVHRQSVAKSVGREISDMFAPMNLDSSPSATGGAEPPPNNRSSSSPEIVRTQDNHLLQYAHNTPNMQPPNIADYIKKPANQSTPNLLGASRNQSSGDSDEDTPLGILMQAKQYNKDPEALRRISTAGSLARGSASIAPSIHGMPPSTSIRPNSGQSHISRPSSRASKLPAFARRAPLPDDLPLMPGYQQGPTFPQASQTFSPLQQWGASVTAPYTPPVVYQNNFGGQYLAPPQPGVPGAPTLMDGLQQEEKMKKWRNRNGNSAQRTTTLPNMGHPQMFNTPMNMGHMGMPQQMPMQGMGAMGMGMGMSMQQQQMQMHMEMQKLQMQMQAMAMGMPQQPQMPHNMSMPQLPLQAPPTGWNSPGTPGRTPLYGSMNGTSAAPSIAPNLQPPMGTGRKSSMLAPIAASPQLSMVMPATTSGLPTGYAPSIAPSERSNIGIPGRYRPVNTADAVSMAGNITPAITPPLDGRDKEKRGVKAWMKHLGGHDGTEDEYDAEGENEDWASMRKGRMARRRDGM